MLHHVSSHDDKDEAPNSLFAFGALLPVEISPPQPLVDLLTSGGKAIPASKTGYGLIDTGATITTIHEAFITEMGVQAVGAERLGTPYGETKEHNTYPIRFKIPSHSVDLELPQIITADLGSFLTPEGEPIICLIGRDFLAGSVLIYNGELGMYTLAT